MSKSEPCTCTETMRFLSACPFPAWGSSPPRMPSFWKNTMGQISWPLPSNRWQERYWPGLKDETRGYLRDKTTVVLHELSWFGRELYRPKGSHEYQLVLEAGSWKFNDITSECGPSMSELAVGRASNGDLIAERVMANPMEKLLKGKLQKNSSRRQMISWYIKMRWAKYSNKCLLMCNRNLYWFFSFCPTI